MAKLLLKTLQPKVTLFGYRELTHYKGEPDPFKGDVPNQRVRDSAKEALDAIFAATDVRPPTTPAPLQVTSLTMNPTFRSLDKQSTLQSFSMPIKLIAFLFCRAASRVLVEAAVTQYRLHHPGRVGVWGFRQPAHPE